MASTGSSNAAAKPVVAPVITGTVQAGSPDFFQGATFQLLAAGMVNGTPFFEVVGNPVAADTSGFFSLSASASCTLPDEELFVIGLSAQIADPAVMVDVGKCGTTLTGTQNVVITETTTLSAEAIMGAYL